MERNEGYRYGITLKKNYYCYVHLHYNMKVEETAAKITSMEIRGAGKIARAAAQALLDFVEALPEHDPNQFIDALTNAKEILHNTRPTAVSLTNALDFVMMGAKGETIEEIKTGVQNAAERFITNSEKSLETIAGTCAKKIKENSTILTHCNSKAALQGIVKAHSQGKHLSVYATETRPWRQGLITAQELADAGVKVTLIVDSATRFFMPDIDMVIIGADTVTVEGTVINKIGTSQVALCAHEHCVPVIVCAESYKFSRASLQGENVEIEERDITEVVENNKLKGVNIRNPVFDATPAKYISAIITEFGTISPYSAYNIIQKIKKEMN